MSDSTLKNMEVYQTCTSPSRLGNLGLLHLHHLKQLARCFPVCMCSMGLVLTVHQLNPNHKVRVAWAARMKVLLRSVTCEGHFGVATWYHTVHSLIEAMDPWPTRWMQCGIWQHWPKEWQQAWLGVWRVISDHLWTWVVWVIQVVQYHHLIWLPAWMVGMV